MLNAGWLKDFEGNDVSGLLGLGYVLGRKSKVGIGFVEIVFEIYE
jgi:hypothetical protein